MRCNTDLAHSLLFRDANRCSDKVGDEKGSASGLKLLGENQLPHTALRHPIKAPFGLKPKVLAEVLFLPLPALENERTARLKNRPTRKRRFDERDGRRQAVQPV